MKKLILLSLAFLASAYSFAQRGITDPKINFGIKVGATFPTFSVSGANTTGIASSSLASYYASALVSIHIIDGMHVQPGLSLVGKGASLNIPGEGTTELSPLYLEVPLNFVISRNFWIGKVFAGAGPYWGFPLSGKLKVAGLPDTDLKFGPEVNDHIKSSDFGFNFLLGYQLKNGLNISGGYGLGLTNVQSNGSIDKSYKNRALSIGLGFLF
ncbi:MAG: outer membrane beta-barrel protein [Sphingobacteriaceae bacterium]|nr:MAG: PorT family protein [Pedobacter sp.]